MTTRRRIVGLIVPILKVIVELIGDEHGGGQKDPPQLVRTIIDVEQELLVLVACLAPHIPSTTILSFSCRYLMNSGFALMILPAWGGSYLSARRNRRSSTARSASALRICWESGFDSSCYYKNPLILITRKMIRGW